MLQKLRYTYDPVGNITRIADEVADTVFYANAVVSPQRDYTYDPLYRLTEATGREHIGQQPTWDAPFNNAPHPEDGSAMRNYTEAYTYDPVGNILELNHRYGASAWTRHYSYTPGTNHLATTQVGASSVAYPHDAHGNMTAMPHLQGMSWDWKDQLQSADKGGGGTVAFTYDAAGQRVRKVWDKGNQVDERLYLGGFEISRTRVGGELRQEWEVLHVLDGQRREALIETKTVDTEAPHTVGTTLVRFQLDDHIGSAAVELDDVGGIISYEEFHPYGSTAFHSVRSGEEVPRKRYRYTGMERDASTGLQRHGARYYAPWLARWTAADPGGLIDGPNRFAFARGNPTRFVDRNGHQATDEALNSRVDNVPGNSDPPNPEAADPHQNEDPQRAWPSLLQFVGSVWGVPGYLVGEGAVAAYNASIRHKYLRDISASSKQAVKIIGHAELSNDLARADRAAKQAVDNRNRKRTEAQAKLSPGARILAETNTHPKDYQARLKAESHRPPFKAREAVANSSGKSRSAFDRVAKASVVGGLAFSILGMFEIGRELKTTPSEQRWAVIAREAVALVGGIVGGEVGLAAGAVVTAEAGPAVTVVGSTMISIVGGLAFAMLAAVALETLTTPSEPKDRQNEFYSDPAVIMGLGGP